MALENSSRGRLQIAVAGAAVVFVMLVAALALYKLGGSRGLSVPTANGSSTHR